MGRGWRILCRVAAVTACLLVVAAPAPASAHAALVATDPGEGAVLASPPDEVVLTFTEPVELLPGGIEVHTPDGETVPAAPASRDAKVVVDVPELAATGTYLLTWRVLSRDGHPVVGSLSFSVGAPSAPPVPQAARAAGSPGALQAVVQALVHLGFLLAAGLALFAAWLLPREEPLVPARRRIRRAVRVAAVTGALAAVLLLPLTLAHQQGVGSATLATAAPWGGLTPTAVLALVLLLAGLALVVAHGHRLLAAGGLGLGALALSLTGHTRGAGVPALAMATDVLHLAAGAIWLGGLVGLALTLPRLGTQRLTARLLARFSGIAALVLALVLVSGAALSWQLLGSWPALVETGYGRLLLAKVALVGLAIGIAAWNRFVLLPRVSGDDRGPGLTRAVLVEAAVLVAAIGVTGSLVHLSPQEGSRTVAASGPVTRVASLGGEVEAVLTLTPGAPGVNVVEVRLRYADGDPVHAHHPPTLALSSPGAHLGEVPLGATTPGSYRAQVVLPGAGRWTARLGARLNLFENPVATVAFRVR